MRYIIGWINYYEWPGIMDMKLLPLFLFAFYAFAGEQAPAGLPGANSASLLEVSPDETKTVSKEDKSGLTELEKDAVMEFLVQEVIPAFNGFQDILFSKPSFEIHWTPKEMQIKHCSFKFQLKQVRTISYNLADLQLYGFQSNAEIGGPGRLFVELSCGGADAVEDVLHFKVKLFAVDEEQKSSLYSFKIMTMNKEQLDLKLKSVELNVDVENVDSILVLDPDEHIEIFPQDSPFLKFFEEEKAYAEADLKNENSGVREDSELKNMYDISLNVWNQMKGEDSQAGSSEAKSLVQDAESSESDSLIPLKKFSISQIINVKGSAEMLLPVYKNGERVFDLAVVPIISSFALSVDGDFIPIMFNASRKKLGR